MNLDVDVDVFQNNYCLDHQFHMFQIFSIFLRRNPILTNCINILSTGLIYNFYSISISLHSMSNTLYVLLESTTMHQVLKKIKYNKNLGGYVDMWSKNRKLVKVSYVNITLISGVTLLPGSQKYNFNFWQYRKLSSLKNPKPRISKELIHII